MIYAVVTLLMGSGSALSAQTLLKKDGKVYVTVDRHTMAVTYCAPMGKDTVAVLTLYNSVYMEDSIQAEGIKVHEAVHRDQLMNDHSLCNAGYGELVVPEAQAYCTEAHFLTRYGFKDEELYWAQLRKMQLFFAGHVPPERVIGAWYAECGGMLHLGAKK